MSLHSTSLEGMQGDFWHVVRHTLQILGKIGSKVGLTNLFTCPAYYQMGVWIVMNKENFQGPSSYSRKLAIESITILNHFRQTKYTHHIRNLTKETIDKSMP